MASIGETLGHVREPASDADAGHADADAEQRGADREAHGDDRAEGDEQHDDGDEQADALVALDLLAAWAIEPLISTCSPASRPTATASSTASKSAACNRLS